MQTLLVLALIGCSAPMTSVDSTAAPKVRAPAAPSMHDPGAVASPYDHTLSVPKLASRASDFDLELLGYRYTVYKIKADFSPVASVTKAESATIRHQLAADPRWRVGVWDGAVVAFQRDGDDDTWSVPRHGYHIDRDSIWRTSIRFDRWSDRSEWSSPELVTRVRADEQQLALRAFQLGDGPGKGMKTTALSVEGPSVAMDVFEARRGGELDVTATALAAVPRALDSLRAERQSIERDGYTQWEMPTAEPYQGIHSHLHMESPEPGRLQVKGRVNPGRPGWTWVRIVDAAGRTWEDVAVAAGTREAVGWSPDPDTQFYFQSQFPVPSGTRFEATAEIWFTPDDSDRSERLAAYNVTVPSR